MQLLVNNNLIAANIDVKMYSINHYKYHRQTIFGESLKGLAFQNIRILKQSKM